MRMSLRGGRDAPLGAGVPCVRGSGGRVLGGRGGGLRGLFVRGVGSVGRKSGVEAEAVVVALGCVG